MSAVHLFVQLITELRKCLKRVFFHAISPYRLLWQLLPRLRGEDESKRVEKHWKLPKAGNRRRLQHQSCRVSEKGKIIIIIVVAIWGLSRFVADLSWTNVQYLQVFDEEEAKAASAAESVCKSPGGLGPAVYGGCGCQSSQERLTSPGEDAPSRFEKKIKIEQRDYVTTIRSEKQFFTFIHRQPSKACIYRAISIVLCNLLWNEPLFGSLEM